MFFLVSGVNYNLLHAHEEIIYKNLILRPIVLIINNLQAFAHSTFIDLQIIILSVEVTGHVFYGETSKGFINYYKAELKTIYSLM